MTKYKLGQNVVLREDGASIPSDERNNGYRDYLDWLGEGNTPEPADPVVYDISIQADSNTIIGNGVDVINLVARGEPNMLITLDVLTGSTPSTVNIQLDENGNGSQAFSCETSPTVIVFSHGDISAKVRAL